MSRPAIASVAPLDGSRLGLPGAPPTGAPPTDGSSVDGSSIETAERP
ncbi:hypothetical protein [Frigoribacterium sp. VKM Ac-2836]|nr:hypothetical protein [Frigoribacterium sp. VKM Ac-2836]